MRLLLGKAADLVIESVVDSDIAADFNREPPSLGEIRIPDAILRTSAGGPTEVSRPPIGGFTGPAGPEPACCWLPWL